MAKKKTFPGSIYKPANANTLYIKFKGKRIATGLQATKEGYSTANKMLEMLYLNYHALGPSKSLITFKEAWELYTQTLIKNEAKTIKNYKYSYNALVGNYSDDFLTTDNIEFLVLRFLKGNKFSNITINTYLNNFQIFLNYCIEKKLLDHINIFKKYKVKTPRNTGQSYTKEECQKIIYYMLHHKYEIGLLIWFMIETGSRVVDALTLEWNQIDFKAKTITWKNKITKEDELTPVSNTAIKLLTILKQMNQKKVFSYLYTSGPTIAQRLNRALKHLGIEKGKRSLQEFRVTFRMRLLSRGTPEVLIEYLLRHSTGKIIHNMYTDFEVFKREILRYLNPELSNNGQAW